MAYVFTLLLSTEVWHLLVANVLIGVGIGFGYASMPMLIMRSVPQSETGASNGLNALFRSLGTSVAAAVVGAVLASNSVDFDGTAGADGDRVHPVVRARRAPRPSSPSWWRCSSRAAATRTRVTPRCAAED